MPFPAHIAYVARGAMPSGEQWSNTLRCAGGTAPYEGLDLQNAAAEARDDWETFLAATASMSVGTTLASVSAYVYDSAGILVEQAVDAPPAYVGNVSQALPNQCAVVASLRTESPLRRAKGRLFLPLLGIALETGGRIPTARRALIGNAAASLLQSAGTWGFDLPDGEIRASVVSGTYGESRPVTEVAIGDLVDTMQSRRKSLVEGYSVFAVPQ